MNGNLDKTYVGCASGGVYVKTRLDIILDGLELLFHIAWVIAGLYFAPIWVRWLASLVA